MISFRFHLVSLVAVFLALGLGVLTGTTVLNRGIVAQLQNNTDRLSRDLAEVRRSVTRLQAEAEVWGTYGQETMGQLLSGRLTGRETILVTQDGTDVAMLSGIRRALEAAGAEVVALLSVSARMELRTDADRQALATALGLDATLDAETLSAEAAALLASRMAQGQNGVDTLEALLDAEFLVVQGTGLVEGALRRLGGPDQLVVAVAGGPAASRLEPEHFLVPLVDGLAAQNMPVSAAEAFTAQEQEPPFVALVRAGDLAGEVSTQDNADQLPGQIGLALALEDLLAGTPGHYGVKDGASRLIPELT